MISFRLLCGLALTALSVSAIEQHDSYTCDSPIYCEGDILKTVQLARIFADSKTFVDMVIFINKKKNRHKTNNFIPHIIAYIKIRSRSH